MEKETLTDTDLATIRQHVEAIYALLPTLTGVKASERRGGVKPGDKSAAFITDCYTFAKLHPKILPSYINADTYKDQYQLRTNLRILSLMLQHLSEVVDRTSWQLDKTLLKHSNSIYKQVKKAQHTNLVPGVDFIYGELKRSNPYIGKHRRKGKKNSG